MQLTSFVPPRWLRSPHVQTIGAAAPLHSPPRSFPNRETIELRVPFEDTRFKRHARVWWASDDARPRPLVAIMHGIAGSSDSHCVVRSAVALHRAGYHVARLDMRAAGASAPDAPSLYHAGLTDDLDAVVRHLAVHPRIESIGVLGFSGGGSVALKLAGEWGTDAPKAVKAVATISAPLDYTTVAARMDSFRCLPYRFHVLRGLVDRAREWAGHHPSLARFDAGDLARIKRFRAYDGDIIVPMFGFSDVDSYYAAASSGPYLDRVDVPTLLVHAEDDPMVPGATVRPWLGHASRAVEVELSERGGHIGWVGGLDEDSWVTPWATRRALSFFERNLPCHSSSS